jgi:type IV pilus assembly protein PilC
LEFRYKAINPSGKTVGGTSSGPSRDEVLDALQKQGYTILDLQAIDGGAAGQEATAGTVEGMPAVTAQSVAMSFRLRNVPLKTVTFFTQQLSALMDAGIPLMEAITAMKNQEQHGRMKEILTQVIGDVQKGISIVDAFSKHRDAFSEMYLSLLAVGEASGNLPMMMGRLGEYLEKEMTMRDKIRSALAYPTFILAFSIVLVYIMVAYMLPGFTPIFTASGLDLHQYPVTLMLMAASDIARNKLIMGLLVGCLVALYFLVPIMLQVRSIRYAADRFLLAVPVLGNFIKLSVVARIANSFGALITSGVPMLQCFDLVSRSANNLVMAAALQKASKDIQQGQDLAVVFQSSGVFPPLMVQMVSIGERAGNLDKMFPRIAKYYEGQLDTSLATLSGLIEPVTMVAVGGIVFVFVLGVLLPILGIAFAVQDQM